MTTLKEKFWSHPVVFGFTLITIGASGGVSFSQLVLPAISSSEESAQVASGTMINCRVEGLEVLEQAHATRMELLHKKLVDLETKASDDTLIGSYQDKYRESADRIREDIKQATISYQAALDTLNLKCE